MGIKEVKDLFAKRRVLVELKLATAVARGNDKKVLTKALKRFEKQNKDIIKWVKRNQRKNQKRKNQKWLKRERKNENKCKRNWGKNLEDCQR